MSEYLYKQVVIIMAGGGAAGKSTTSKAFAKGEPDQHREKQWLVNSKGEDVEENVHWTIYDNCALCGNHHSGTDANKGPHTVRASFEELREHHDVIIIDGYTSSPRWIDIVNDWQDEAGEVAVLVVHFKLSPEELLNRLANRRGVTPDSIREKYLPTREGVGRRGDNLTRYFEERSHCDVYVIEVGDKDDTETIVGLIDDELEYIWGCTDDETD